MVIIIHEVNNTERQIHSYIFCIYKMNAPSLINAIEAPIFFKHFVDIDFNVVGRQTYSVCTCVGSFLALLLGFCLFYTGKMFFVFIERRWPVQLMQYLHGNGLSKNTKTMAMQELEIHSGKTPIAKCIEP